jgi:lycopene cyclase domain-containing protein
MTYLGFLLAFLFVPILVFQFITWRDEHHRLLISGFRNGLAVWCAIAIHIVLALLYTTPWDNYLVATGVWYYNPVLVTGKVIGYVPIEEYTFFIVETLLTGLWWWFIARRISPPIIFNPSTRMRIIMTLFLTGCWIIALGLFINGSSPATYFAITLLWALPPIGLQLAFGADILWKHGKLVLLTILPMTIYLSLVDSLAITSGTWTISPSQSTGYFIGGLPVEEAIFFLLTNILIGFGMTLLLADESKERYEELLSLIKKGHTR